MFSTSAHISIRKWQDINTSIRFGLGVDVDRIHIKKNGVHACRWGYTPGKPCIPVQPAEVGARLNTSKSPLRKVIDVQDADKSSDQVTTGPYNKNLADRKVITSLNQKQI